LRSALAGVLGSGAESKGISGFGWSAHSTLRPAAVANDHQFILQCRQMIVDSLSEHIMHHQILRRWQQRMSCMSPLEQQTQVEFSAFHKILGAAEGRHV